MRGQIRGVFHAAGGRMLFAAGTKGGVRHNKAWGWNIPTFLELFCFPWFAPTNRLPACRDRKIKGDDSDPPRKGGSYRPRVAARCGTPLHRPQGVAIVGIYPCGKARKRRPGAAGIKRRMALWNCGRTGGN